MFNIKGLGPDGNERLVIALSITLPIICCIVAGIMAGNNASDEAITTMLVIALICFLVPSVVYYVSRWVVNGFNPRKRQAAKEKREAIERLRTEVRLIGQVFGNLESVIYRADTAHIQQTANQIQEVRHIFKQLVKDIKLL